MKKLFVSYLFICFSSVLNAQNIKLQKPKTFSSKETTHYLNFKPQSLQLNEDALCWLSEIKNINSFKFIDDLISYSKKFLGVRYRYAGRSPYGFDCSGFTSFVYSKFGFSLARSAPGQAIVGVDINKEEAQKGDLIFFKGRNWRSNYVGHVGLVISNENGKITFIHASVCFGIIIENTEVPYYSARFIKVSRINDANS